MAGSVNKVILVGNLGKDPEIRRTQDGRPIVQLNVATSDPCRDKTTGERRERTEWHRVVIFAEPHEHTNPPRPLALLRARRERPRSRAAEQRDEVEPF